MSRRKIINCIAALYRAEWSGYFITSVMFEKYRLLCRIADAICAVESLKQWTKVRVMQGIGAAGQAPAVSPGRPQRWGSRASASVELEQIVPKWLVYFVEI